MIVFWKQLEQEGFFSTGSPAKEDIDVQIMEQGLLIRKKAGKGNGKEQGKRDVVVFKGYGSVEG